MFSKACEHGIRAALYIALQSQQGIRVSLKDIAKEIDSPLAFTAKILQQLVKNNIINSAKGPGGGFDVDMKKIDRIPLSRIVFAIDGDDIYHRCGMGLKECSEKRPCPVHYKFKNIRNELINMLETTNLKSLSTGLMDGSTFLKK